MGLVVRKSKEILLEVRVYIVSKGFDGTERDNSTDVCLSSFYDEQEDVRREIY